MNQGNQLNWCELIVNHMQEWRHLKQNLVVGGGVYVGSSQNPDSYYPSSWLHFYAPKLRAKELDEIESYFDLTLPEDFRTVYLTSNGLHFFHEGVSLFGWKNERTKQFCKASLSAHSVWLNRIEDKKEHQWIFGKSDYYYNTTCFLYLDTKSGEVYRTKNEYTMEPVHRWINLKDMLLSEYLRLEKLYDKTTGKRLKALIVLPEGWDTPWKYSYSFPATHEELEELYKSPKAMNFYESDLFSHATEEQYEAFRTWLRQKKAKT